MLSTTSPSVVSLAALLQLMQLNKGCLSVAAFMDFVLNHQQYGYYRQLESIGQTGDFVTAPHLTSLFGEVLGAWLVDRWHTLGRPQNVDLIELGPGHGFLLKDILSVCQLEPDLMSGLQIKCLEINPVFRQYIADHNNQHTIQYFDQFDDILKPQRTSFVIANEFFDALPVHQFQYCQQHWVERKITVSASQLEFVVDDTNTLDDFCNHHQLSRNLFSKAGQQDDILEINLSAFNIINRIAGHIQDYGGAALICDYGGMMAGYNDTLQAVSRHQKVDLSSVLTQACDITSHVDFFRLMQNLENKTDLSVTTQTQQQFLIESGIMQRALQLKHQLSPQQLLNLDQALHRLLSPEQMGNLFKIMSIYK